MKFLKIIIISVLFSSVSLSQTKTRVVGSEKKLDYPSRSASAGVKFYKKALSSRSKAKQSELFKKSLGKFKEALGWLDKFEKNSALDPKKKYIGGKAKKYRIQFANSAAKAAARSKDYSDADKYFGKIIKTLDPKNYKVWYDYGDYLFKRSQKGTARNAFLNAIKFANSDLTASNRKTIYKAKKYTSKSFYKIAEIDARSSFPGKAIHSYKQAIVYNTNYWQAYLKMGKEYEKQKKYNGMLASYKNVLRIMETKRKGKYIVPKSHRLKQVARSTMLKGVAEYFLSRYALAAKTLRSVAKIRGAKKSDVNSARYHLGMCYLKLGKTKNALAYFKKTKGEYKKLADYEIDGIKRK